MTLVDWTSSPWRKDWHTEEVSHYHIGRLCVFVDATHVPNPGNEHHHRSDEAGSLLWRALWWALWIVWVLSLAVTRLGDEVLRSHIWMQRPFLLRRTAVWVAFKIVCSLFTDGLHPRIPLTGACVAARHIDRNVIADSIWKCGWGLSHPCSVFCIWFAVPPTLHGLPGTVSTIVTRVFGTECNLFEHIGRGSEIQKLKSAVNIFPADSQKRFGIYTTA